jgi:ZIP family zinc transporter
MTAQIVTNGLLGSLVAGLATGLGAAPIFLRATWGRTSQVVMLALAAGVMLGATVFSLLVPALALVTAAGGSPLGAALRVGGGILLGALGIWGVHAVVPHEHFVKGEEGRAAGQARLQLGRNWLFVLAITLHNVPEGMSVGVAWGADQATGLAVTIGIGLQNVPEGLAVAAALVGDGFRRGHAFKIALLTGLVEPVGGLVGALAVGASQAVLPWGLAGAGGAMLFIISGEIIPETHRHGVERQATFSLVVGFILMMILDVALA